MLEEEVDGRSITAAVPHANAVLLELRLLFVLGVPSSS
jgi:hypothetical protein